MSSARLCPLFFSLVLLASNSVTCTTSSSATLRLRLFPEELADKYGARCLDHSLAGYYIREQDPKKWVIFLEGGGLCVTAFDCVARRSNSQGSSKYWQKDVPPEGLATASLSPNNPFASFSHIWVPYCSGDMWLGNSSQPRELLFGMQMSGHLILEALIDHLLAVTAMGSEAEDVVLSGSSAGGIGTFHHTDWLADRLAAHAKQQRLKVAARVSGFPIEGIFFPIGFPVFYEEFILGSRRPADHFMDHYIRLMQDPWLLPACVEASRKEGFAAEDCFDVSRMVRYTRSPLFILMNRFDALMIQDMGLCPNCQGTAGPTTLTGKYIRFFGSLMNNTLVNISRALPSAGFFVPSEFHHDESFYALLGSTKKHKVIGGMTLPQAFEAWHFGSGRRVFLMEPTCHQNGPCNAASEDVAGRPRWPSWPHTNWSRLSRFHINWLPFRKGHGVVAAVHGDPEEAHEKSAHSAVAALPLHLV